MACVMNGKLCGDRSLIQTSRTGERAILVCFFFFLVLTGLKTYFEQLFICTAEDRIGDCELTLVEHYCMETQRSGGSAKICFGRSSLQRA